MTMSAARDSNSRNGNCDVTYNAIANIILRVSVYTNHDKGHQGKQEIVYHLVRTLLVSPNRSPSSLPTTSQ